MENVIEVSITTLEQDTFTMLETLSDLNQKIQEIDGIVTSLNGVWESEAKKSFMSHYENDKQTFLTILENIDEVLKSMQNAKKAYARCENTVKQNIAAIRI